MMTDSREPDSLPTSLQVQQIGKEKPRLEARWFYAWKKRWAVFSDEDNAALERKWVELGGEQIECRTDEALADESNDGDNTSRKGGQGDSGEHLEKTKRMLLPRSPPSGIDAVESAMQNLQPSGNKSENERGSEAKNRSKQSIRPSKIMVNRTLDPILSPSHPARRTTVAVLEDRLFDADLSTMTMYPVFFKGMLVQIMRATYFYSSMADGSYAPIGYDEELATDLEMSYDQVKPWTFDRTQANGEVQNNNQVELPCMAKQAGTVHWESATSAKLFSVDFGGRFLSILGGSKVIRGFREADRIARERSSGTLIEHVQTILPWFAGDSDSDSDSDLDSDSYNGAKGGRAEATQARKKHGDTSAAKGRKGKLGASCLPKHSASEPGEDEDQGGSSNEGSSFAARLWPSSENSIWLLPVNGIRKIFGASNEELQKPWHDKSTEQVTDGEPTQDETSLPEPPSDRAGEPPELVLCIHGIGQELAGDFDGLNFVYDVERLRGTSRNQAERPEMRKLSRGRRVQFLPICWRSGLSFDRQVEGNDNFFTLMDVSNNVSIPVVRNVISKVLLDVPFYLSSHRKSMIQAVKRELNRVYRLFVQRNPAFECEGGRVSLICHSLGSALGSAILSEQPTHVKLLSELSKEELEQNENRHLLFNVKHCFFIGSPVGFFLYLDGGQLIARKGNNRTEGMEDEAVSDRVGHYGCLATETLFNIYHSSDPVGYNLSATCDGTYAKVIKQVSIQAAPESILESLSLPRLSISKIFGVGEHPFSALRTYSKDVESGKVNLSQADARSQEKHEGRQKASSDPKQAADTFSLKAFEKGEKRFRALNPFGCIDFVLDGQGFSEYLHMLTAHTSYWTSEAFNLLLLSCLFMDQQPVCTVPQWKVPIAASASAGEGRADRNEPHESHGLQKEPTKQDIQPFVISPSSEQPQTPFTDCINEASQVALQGSPALRVWAVDVSRWLATTPEDELPRLAEELLASSPEAAEKVKHYVKAVDKARALAGQLLPRLVYNQLYSCRWGEMKFSKTREGRPYLSSPRLEHTTDYNVTHDGDWVAIAFHEKSHTPDAAAKKSHKPGLRAQSLAEARLGIDVMSRTLPRYESSVRNLVDTMNMTMTPAEKDWVLSASPGSRASSQSILSREQQRARPVPLSFPDAEMLARQFDLWTHKEALTKNFGNGLGFDFAKIQLALWECEGKREERCSRQTILEVEGQRDGSYRFIEMVLPPGEESVNGEACGVSQLVVAEGPLEECTAQVQPAWTSENAINQGLLRIWSMQDLIDTAYKQQVRR
ncbi:hypothetical protein K437DRAFT_237777 [Tilletiaria anomala UBC 951]|uniref:DDHD domain-containing protein n=1 Tax=Tilletiaria anomala (strain ATCC 24038 / CBS 436.72 / UBC 951) TaxID=1037660 RepID=A0A066VQ68_TILAU|nr:uncharacterized protein K437DRAFT_237777 [Tilletiaria anomala UBC 951]KDN42398.1 hypothetical protein K437DRAFT_237777 [Tilletiaria anomala UBC 951]